MIASFNRVKALSEDVQVVAEALRQSMVLEVNDDGSMVRRAMPFSAETADDSTVGCFRLSLLCCC